MQLLKRARIVFLLLISMLTVLCISGSAQDRTGKKVQALDASFVIKKFSGDSWSFHGDRSEVQGRPCNTYYSMSACGGSNARYVSFSVKKWDKVVFFLGSEQSDDMTVSIRLGDESGVRDFKTIAVPKHEVMKVEIPLNGAEVLRFESDGHCNEIFFCDPVIIKD